MSGLLSINVQEARGFLAVPADLDNLAVVIGCTSGTPGLYPYYRSGATAQAAVGYGDASDTLCQIIEQRQDGSNGVKRPAAIYVTASATDGSYGTINNSGVIGTAIPTVDPTSDPYGTYYASVRIIDDGNGGAGTVLGNAGIRYQASLDAGDLGAADAHWSVTRNLGTAYEIAIANSGVNFLLEPPAAQVTAYITYINAIRTAALAHFPYTTGTVHGSADNTSGAGVAVAATTVAEGITLSGTLITALGLHFAEGATVHLTADVTTSLAAATAAQAVAVASGSAQDAITVALLLETALETHEANLTYHTIADAVNVVSAAQPTRGTLRTGDTWKVRTLAPAPGATEVAQAFADLAASSTEHSLVVLDFPLTPAIAAAVTAGLSALATNRGRLVTAICRTRLPDFETSETEATWVADVESDFALGVVDDSRIHLRASYCFVTDAMTGNQYLRSDLAQFAADAVRAGRAVYFGSPNDRLAGIANVTLVDPSGVLRGHDEGPGGNVTGLSDDGQANRFGCQQRMPISLLGEAVYNTYPWVLYAADERIRTLFLRRLANAMERTALLAALPNLGGTAFYRRTSPTAGILNESSRQAIQASIYQPVSQEFGNEIDNASDASLDTGLVQVSPNITLGTGGRITVDVTLAPIVGGKVVTVNITLAVQE